jgi:ribosomal protein S13
VRKIKKNNINVNRETIIIIAIAAAGAIGIAAVMKILQKLGVFKSKEQKEQEKNTEDAIKKMKKIILQTQRPTKTPGEWAIIADQIWNDLKYSSVSDNKDDAAYQVCRVKNDADFVLLNDLFGERKEWYFGIPTGKLTFVPYVSSNLSRKKLDAINDNYKQKGIRFRF